MGLNAAGIAVSRTAERLEELTDLLNFIVEGPLEECLFEEALSNQISEDALFFTPLENGSLITVFNPLLVLKPGVEVLSASGHKLTKFMYGETSGVYHFEYAENGEILRIKGESEGKINQDKGKTLPIEYSGIGTEELVLEMIRQACGEELFNIEPDVKTYRYKFISGKPQPSTNSEKTEVRKNEKKKPKSTSESKLRLIFLLVTLHILFGLSNLATANFTYGKPIIDQIPTYASLIIYAVMAYVLLLRKNWMRILFIVMYFVSLPFSLIIFRPNTLFLNNLFQLGVATFITILLFQKDLKNLFNRNLSDSADNHPFKTTAPKELGILVLGVLLFQFGAADYILEWSFIPMGFLTGIISGGFIVAGIYLIISTLKRNYYG